MTAQGTLPPPILTRCPACQRKAERHFAVIANGEGGVAALLDVVRATWAAGRDFYADRLTLRRHEPESSSPAAEASA